MEKNVENEADTHVCIRFDLEAVGIRTTNSIPCYPKPQTLTLQKGYRDM